MQAPYSLAQVVSCRSFKTLIVRFDVSRRLSRNPKCLARWYAFREPQHNPIGSSSFRTWCSRARHAITTSRSVEISVPHTRKSHTITSSHALRFLSHIFSVHTLTLDQPTHTHSNSHRYYSLTIFTALLELINFSRMCVLRGAQSAPTRDTGRTRARSALWCSPTEKIKNKIAPSPRDFSTCNECETRHSHVFIQNTRARDRSRRADRRTTDRAGRRAGVRRLRLEVVVVVVPKKYLSLVVSCAIVRSGSRSCANRSYTRSKPVLCLLIFWLCDRSVPVCLCAYVHLCVLGTQHLWRARAHAGGFVTRAVCRWWEGICGAVRQMRQNDAAARDARSGVY